MKKKVVVTGANGFVGRYLIEILTKNDYQIFAVVRNKANNLELLLNNDKIKIIYCDLDDYKNLGKLFSEKEFDVFFHLAWDGSSGDKRSDYSLQLKNVQACVEAINTAVDLNCKRFVGAGSITELMYRNYIIQDYSKPAMSTIYAVAKMTAEYMCRCISVDKDIEFVWGYLSNFYGVGDNSDNFINYLLLSYLNNNVPKLTNGEQLADFTYVSDIAMGIFLLGEKAIPGCNYYVGYGNPKPLKNFVRKVHSMVNTSIEDGLGKKEFNGLGLDFELINMNKLYNDTGFKPLISFEQGIKETLDWLKIYRR